MRARWVVAAFLLTVAAGALADVDVRLADGKVDIRAKTAPLSDILDRLGRLTGMKVVYDGPPPRQSLTVTLQGRTPAEAVLTLLDGLGLNYALLMDKTGTRVQQLLMAGSAPVATSRPAAPPARFPVAPTPPPDEAEEPDEPMADEPDAEGEDRPPGLVPGAVPGLVPGQDIPFTPGMPPGATAPSLGPGIRPLAMPTPPPQDEPGPVPSPRPPT